MTRRLLILLLAGAVCLAGCGGGGDIAAEPTAETVTVTRTVERAVERAADTAAAAKRARTPAPRRETAYVKCDQNIRARKGTTSCEFANNAFYEYWRSGEASTLRVYSPASARTYTTRCSSDGEWVRCRASDGGVAKLRTSAVDLYDADQAAAYRDSHDTGPESDADGSSNGYEDSDGYDSYDDPGSYDYDDESSAGSDFCDTHDCIPNYPNGRGDTVQCADGSYSQSGGIQGARSHHGGVAP